jgi:hypothetical protein
MKPTQQRTEEGEETCDCGPLPEARCYKCGRFKQFSPLPASRLTALELELQRAKEALRKLAKCSGGCDGPLGCMCNAPIARAALRDLGEGQ